MCDAGRIRHHLKHNLWIAENIILIAGYQSKGTLGRALLDGVKEVRLFGEDIAVNAEIAVLHGTSGHADQKGLFNWVEAFAKAGDDFRQPRRYRGLRSVSGAFAGKGVCRCRAVLRRGI